MDLLNMNSALSAKFLLWALILFCCPDPGWTTQAEDMASLNNLMDRMTRMEAEMAAKDDLQKELETREQRIAVLEDAMETKDQRIAVLEDAMETKDQRIAVLEDAMETKDHRIAVLEDVMETKDQRIDDPPYAFQCAYQDSWSADYSVITYDRLTFDEISGGSIYNVSGGLDITTGVFTVGHGFSGVWTVSYSMRSYQSSGEYNYAWLYINGEQIEESEHVTYYSGSEGWVGSLGSRSLYMRLEAGDTISLRTGLIEELAKITLCFELAQFDLVP